MIDETSPLPPEEVAAADGDAAAAREAAALDDAAILVERGKALVAGGRPAAAVAFFERAVALAPDDRDGRTQRLVALRHAGRSAAAVAAADEILSATPDSAFVWNEKGKALHDLGRHTDAIDAFGQALVHDPTNVFANSWKGTSLSELGRYEAAAAAFDCVLAADPLNGFARDSKIAALRALGDGAAVAATRQQSLRAARDVLASDPSHLVALQEEVSTLRALQRLEEASKRAAAALAHHPDVVFLINEAAAINAQLGRWRQAVDLFGRALSVEPENEFAHRLRLQVLRAGGRFSELREALDQLPSALRENPGILVERGWLALQEKRPSEAEEIFRAAIAAEPSPEATYSLSTALERQGRIAEALECLEELRRARPRDVEIAERIGWFHLRRNRLDEARRVFGEIAEADSDHIGALNARGALAFTEERYEDAAEAFRKVSEKEPWNAVWHANLAWALVRSAEGRRRTHPARERFGLIRSPPGPLEEAEERCRQALILDPLYPQAHGCLGVIAFKRGRHREAESHFERSMERDRSEGNLADLGALWAEIGKPEQAEAILREALAANPDDQTARVELGGLLVGVGRADEAIRELRQAVAYAPEDPRPARSLALALLEDKRWHEAEDVLRKAIQRIEPHRAWQLHLTLSHLLVLRGDESDDSQLYEEARRANDEARRLRPDEPEVCFQAGVVWYRLEAYERALRNFRRCAALDAGQFEATRNAERLRRLIRSARVRERGGVWASLLLVGVSLLQLVVAWGLFVNGELAEGSLLTFASVSLGLLVVAVLLPWLILLKLPGGFEAQLAERTPAISPGPRGEGSLGSESAPRGQAAIGRGPA